jgi:hypothetical protein
VVDQVSHTYKTTGKVNVKKGYHFVHQASAFSQHELRTKGVRSHPLLFVVSWCLYDTKWGSQIRNAICSLILCLWKVRVQIRAARFATVVQEHVMSQVGKWPAFLVMFRSRSA